MNKSTASHLFDEDRQLCPENAWKLYDEAEAFNDKIRLYDNVRDNENMFIGKQWEGIQANGLPTPIFNFIKRTILFKVASITSDNMKVNVAPLDASVDTASLFEPSRIVSEEFEALMERNRVVRLAREFCRDAAVRGDGCLYVWWDDEAVTGKTAGDEAIRGQIATEVLQNTRVYFGDPNERRVQKQPYVLVKSYVPLKEIRRRARKNGVLDWQDINADENDQAKDDAKKTDDKVTVLLLLWKDPDSGEVWGYEFTKDAVIREPFNMKIRLYPLVWFNWDYVQDCYHGQAEVTGLIPNQVAYNKVWAASILSILTLAFPKVLYDPTRIKGWTNKLGASIECIGGDMDKAVKIVDPGAMSPQVYQVLGGLVDQTERCMGVSGAAMGDARPDNASAIIALQRAAATPMELTKLSLYEGIEDLFRIYLEFIIYYYGTRTVDTKTPEKVDDAIQFAAQSHPEIEASQTVPTSFDFSSIEDIPMNLKLDVGASSYYSEIAALSTLGEWMKAGAISPRQCAERMPSGFLPKLDELVEELREQEAAQTQMQSQGGGAGSMGGGAAGMMDMLAQAQGGTAATEAPIL